jgi:prevent-host-death family protein
VRTKWRLQDAQARISELIDDALRKGPQIVTRRGIDLLVVMSVEEWNRLKQKNQPTWKDILLCDDPRFELPLPKGGRAKLRKAPEFD